MLAHESTEQPVISRLSLCDSANLQGAVDGAWWPQSTDLKRELPDLVIVLGRLIGPVRRVIYDPNSWPPTPSRIVRGGTATSVDPYRLVAGDTIYLLGTHSRAAVLFVVPPTTPPPAAHRVLRMVADTVAPITAAVLRRLVCQPTPAPVALP
jgi:hypothetical protein